MTVFYNRRIVTADFHRFSAIFTTTLVREEYKKVVVDPVRLEFFRGGARTFSIPAATGRIFPVGMESKLLTMPVTLTLDPNSYYIVLTARSDDPIPPLDELRASVMTPLIGR